MVSTSGRSSRGPCSFQQFEGRNDLRLRAAVQRSQPICDEFDVDVLRSSTILPGRSKRVCRVLPQGVHDTDFRCDLGGGRAAQWADVA